MKIDPAVREPLVKNALKMTSGQPLLSAQLGPSRVSPQTLLQFIRDVRDTQIWQFPILPGAVLIYQQLCAGREWQITAKPRPAFRAVEFVNGVKTISLSSGMVYYGFEDFLRRRSLDNISVGRTAFHFKKGRNSKSSVFEYIDPTELRWNRQESRTSKSGEQIPVTNSEKVWFYPDGRQFKAGDIHINHTIPIGGRDLFMSPIAFLLPTAMLAYLIREHDTAAVDGRRIRDIIVVGSEQLSDAIVDALETSIALWAGADPTKVGIPVVTINNLTGTPIENQFSRIGIANVPEALDRQKFNFAYANQISSTLGLALRHFWNEEVTTNRALEEIQEQRQLQKGPSAFVRSEERLMNASGVVSQFGGARFNFIEEVDSASQKINAEVLKLTAEALEKVAGVFGATLSLDAMLAWMQSIRVLPNDLQLVTMEDEDADTAPLANENPDDKPLPQDGDEIAESDPTPITSLPTKTKNLDYDEIVVDSSGRVVERRFKVFSVIKHIAHILETEQKAIEPFDEEKEFKDAVETAKIMNLITFKATYPNDETMIESWIGENPIYSFNEVIDVVQKAFNGETLTDEQHAIIDRLNEFMMRKLNG